MALEDKMRTRFRKSSQPGMPDVPLPPESQRKRGVMQRLKGAGRKFQERRKRLAEMKEERFRRQIESENLRAQAERAKARRLEAQVRQAKAKRKLGGGGPLFAMGQQARQRAQAPTKRKKAKKRKKKAQQPRKESILERLERF